MAAQHGSAPDCFQPLFVPCFRFRQQMRLSAGVLRGTSRSGRSHLRRTTDLPIICCPHPAVLTASQPFLRSALRGPPASAASPAPGRPKSSAAGSPPGRRTDEGHVGGNPLLHPPPFPSFRRKHSLGFVRSSPLGGNVTGAEWKELDDKQCRRLSLSRNLTSA